MTRTMIGSMRWKAGLVVMAGAAAGAALAQPQQQVTGPVAVYWMTAETTAGFGAMNRGAGSNLSALMGGGGAQRSLRLQLGSSQRPGGEARAEHLPPATLGAGPSLPLVTPTVAPPEPAQPGEIPRDFEKPRGKMLIFWGCGERAPAGQPVVIDFAQLSSPEGARRMAALSQGFSFAPMQPPAPGRNATYGEWPNQRARTSVPPNGSLVGAHAVRGNYSPDIDFSIAADQDFLAPLNLVANSPAPAGYVQLAWNPVANATAYFAMAMGASDNGETMVFWSSSQVQGQAFTAPDFISQADVNRLVAQRVLMSPQQTSCQVYREVAQAAGSAMLQMTAYGPETNISYPPRPENRATPWNVQWTVKLRTKSTFGGILGMTMPGQPGYEDDGQPPAPNAGRNPPSRNNPPATPPIPRKPKASDILRGLGF